MISGPQSAIAVTQGAIRWSTQSADFIVGDGCGVVNAVGYGAWRRMDLASPFLDHDAQVV